MVWASYNLVATVSLLTILCLTDGQAWNVQDSLEGFKEYFETSKKLVHQMASHAQDGFELLSKFEQFMSHSLDEDCLYECPKLGQVTVPNPNHRPSSNGCGSLDVIFDDSTNSLIHFEKAFTECCNEHDICYDHCNADKEECDFIFKRCLYAVCKTKENKREDTIFDVTLCKAKAKLSYVTLVGVGCSSFRNAQKEACLCKP